MASLKKKVIHGVGWSVGARIIKQLCSFIITAILARLLSPNEFGLIGMVTVFTGFAAIFSELGLSAALIQNQNVDERHYSSAFFLNIVCGTFLTLFFIILSPIIAAFYDNPQLKLLITVLSFDFIISSFSILQRTLMVKEMRFKKIALIETISTVTSGFTGIVLALRGFGVWSLVFQMLTLSFITMVLLWVFLPFRPKLIFSVSAIKDIFPFSAHLTGFNIINYFARNIDYLLIGKFLGPEALGYYTLAYKLMMYPLRNISQVIGQVAYPAFSKIQDDLEKVRNNYLRMIKLISIVTFPMMFGLFAIAPEFVQVVYGAQWSQVTILIRIFCICGLFQSIGTTIGNILLSQGRADLQFKLQLLGTFIVTISVLVGLNWGIKGVAVAYTCQSMIWVNFTFFVTNKIINQKMNSFYFLFTKELLFSILMVCCIGLFKLVLVFNNAIQLSVLILIGFIAYSLLLILTNEIHYLKNI